MNAMIKKCLLTLTSAAALSVATVPAVSARSVGGAAGDAQNLTVANCFSRVNGTVSSSCGSGFIAPYEVQLEVDTAGTKSVSFTGKNGVGCSANALSSTDTSFSSSGTLAAPGATLTNVPLSGVTVLGSGKLWLRCDFPVNGAVAEVNWNQ